MRSPLLPVFTACLLAVESCAAFAQSNGSPETARTAAPAASAGHKGAAASDFIVAEPIHHKNLAIFPVLSKIERNADRYITLDEGLRAHTVEVIEVGANANGDQRQADRPIVQAPANLAVVGGPRQQGIADGPRPQPNQPGQAVVTDFRAVENSGSNEVNRLMVINKSGKPLYLMPGEVIVGGSQDRTIGQETEIASTGKPVSIDVFCVEHGRWSVRDEQESAELFHALDATKVTDAGALAGEAGKGKFVATPGPLSKAGRVAVQSGKGQGEVWDNVAKANAALKVDSSSGAFTEAYASKSVRDDLQPYVAALSGKVASTDRVVGAVVAIGGKIESVDVFESTPLFRKLWPKLLKSYALDAVAAAQSDAASRIALKPGSKGQHAGTKPTVAKEATIADASAFLAKVFDGDVRDTKQTGAGLVVTHRETKDALSYSAKVGGMGGAPIHAAGYAQ